MSEKQRTIKALILISIMFAGFFIIIPPSSAQSSGLTNVTQVVTVEFSSGQLKEAVVPKSTPNYLDLNITYSFGVGGGIIGSALIKNLVLSRYTGVLVNIKLDILEYPTEWAQVSLTDYTIPFVIDQNQLSQKFKTQMAVTANEDAPAYSQGLVKISASVAGINTILYPDVPSFEKIFELGVFPEYLGIVDPKPVGSNTKRIGPMDTAEFPIEVVNKANERTTIQFRINNRPSGWDAIITDSITLDVGEKTTVYLSVQPPRGLGYHYDIETFEVSVTPARAANLLQKGEERLVTVMVESQGFSVIGFEMLLIPLIIIIVLVALLYYFFIVKRR